MEANKEVGVGNVIEAMDSRTKIRYCSVVLLNLFSQVDYDTLKAVRSVCYDWYDESLFEFQKRTKQVLNFTSYYQKFVLSTNPTPGSLNYWDENDNVSELEINMIDVDKILNEKLFFENNIGKGITCLSFVFINRGYHGLSGNEITKILCNCRNVKDLRFKNMSSSIAENITFPDQDSVTVCRILCLRFTETTFKRDHFKLFLRPWLKSLSQLERIEFDVDIENSYRGKRHLENFVENVSITPSGYSNGYNYNFFVNPIKEFKFLSANSAHLFRRHHLVPLFHLNNKLTKLEIGYMNGLESTDDENIFIPENMGLSQDEFLNLLSWCQHSLEVLRISCKFYQPKDVTMDFPVMEKLRVLEIDWDGVSSIQTANYDPLPKLEKLKLVYPKCGYRKMDYYNKAKLKVPPSYPLWSSGKLVRTKTLESKSPELLTNIITTVFLTRHHNCNVISVDLTQTKHDTVINFLLDTARTNIEQMYISIGCNVNSDEENYLCCDILSDEDYDSIETRNMTYLWDDDHNQDEQKDEKIFFQKLRKFELTIVGCGKIDASVLRDVGVLQKIKCSPVIEDVTLKYKLVSQSTEVPTKTCRLFSDSK